MQPNPPIHSSYFNYITQPIRNNFNRTTQIAHQTWQIPKDFVVSTKWYQRTIKLLKPLDYTLFTTSVVLSVIIDIVAIKRLEIGIAPVLVTANFLLFIPPFLISRHRLHSHFDRVACDTHLEELRTLFHNLHLAILEKREPAQIATRIDNILKTLTTDAEFSHQKVMWESLQTKYQDFYGNFYSPNQVLCFELQIKLVLMEVEQISQNENNPAVKKALQNLQKQKVACKIEEIERALRSLSQFNLIEQKKIELYIEKLLKAPKIIDAQKAIDNALKRMITKLGGTPIT